MCKILREPWIDAQDFHKKEYSGILNIGQSSFHFDKLAHNGWISSLILYHCQKQIRK